MKNRATRRLFLKHAGLIGGLSFFNSCSSLPDKKTEDRDSDVQKKVFRKGRKILHRLVVVSDTHWKDSITSTGQHRLRKWANDIIYTERYDRLISFLNKEAETDGVDYFIFNGDTVTNCPEYFPGIKQKFEQLKAPYYVVHGNHDHCNDEQWTELWGYKRNHTYTIGDYAVILLNSAGEKGAYQCADSVWLEEQLETHKDKKGIFVFCHIFQHDSGELIFASVDCPAVSDVMAVSENLKMAVYSHNHLQDSCFLLNHKGKQIKTFFTGHFSSWGIPYLGYRVLEIYDDGGIATYMFDQEKDKVVNYNLV